MIKYKRELWIGAGIRKKRDNNKFCVTNFIQLVSLQLVD